MRARSENVDFEWRMGMHSILYNCSRKKRSKSEVSATAYLDVIIAFTGHQMRFEDLRDAG